MSIHLLCIQRTYANCWLTFTVNPPSAASKISIYSPKTNDNFCCTLEIDCCNCYTAIRINWHRKTHYTRNAAHSIGMHDSVEFYLLRTTQYQNGNKFCTFNGIRVQFNNEHLSRAHTTHTHRKQIGENCFQPRISIFHSIHSFISFVTLFCSA